MFKDTLAKVNSELSQIKTVDDVRRCVGLMKQLCVEFKAEVLPGISGESFKIKMMQEHYGEMVNKLEALVHRCGKLADFEVGSSFKSMPLLMKAAEQTAAKELTSVADAYHAKGGKDTTDARWKALEATVSKFVQASAPVVSKAYSAHLDKGADLERSVGSAPRKGS